jgi:hypothetical protein
LTKEDMQKGPSTDNQNPSTEYIAGPIEVRWRADGFSAGTGRDDRSPRPPCGGFLAERRLLVLAENPIPADLQWKNPLKGSGSGFGRGGDTSRLVPTTSSHGEGWMNSLADGPPSPGRESRNCEHDQGEVDPQCGFFASPPLPSLQPPSRPPSTAPPSCSANGSLRGS